MPTRQFSHCDAAQRAAHLDYQRHLPVKRADILAGDMAEPNLARKDSGLARRRERRFAAGDGLVGGLRAR